MRRKEKEISDLQEIEAIINEAEVCRLGLAVDNTPYVVPLFFGYDNRCLYIHCAREGRKLDMIRQNSTVCFEMSVDVNLINRDESACRWSSTYRSVIGYGEASIIDDFEEKKQALDIIMKHYSQKTTFEYAENSIAKVSVIKIAVREMSGKTSG